MSEPAAAAQKIIVPTALLMVVRNFISCYLPIPMTAFPPSESLYVVVSSWV